MAARVLAAVDFSRVTAWKQLLHWLLARSAIALSNVVLVEFGAFDLAETMALMTALKDLVAPLTAHDLLA